MSDSDAVDTLLRDTESLFNDSPRRTAPTRSAMGDRGGGVIDTGGVLVLASIMSRSQDSQDD